MCPRQKKSSPLPEKKHYVKTLSSKEEVKFNCLEEGKSKAYQFRKFCSQNGSININKMWKLKIYLWPKHKESIQTGKINDQGKLLAGHKDIKKLLQKEYHERLKSRPYHPDLKDIEMVKKEA